MGEGAFLKGFVGALVLFYLRRAALLFLYFGAFLRGPVSFRFSPCREEDRAFPFFLYD